MKIDGGTLTRGQPFNPAVIGIAARRALPAASLRDVTHHA